MTSDETESALNAVQTARCEALYNAHEVLTHASTQSGPMGLGNEDVYPLGRARDYASDLVMIAQFILTGEAVYPSPFATVETVELTDHRKCACRIAEEFTTDDVVDSTFEREVAGGGIQHNDAPVEEARRRFAEFPEER